MPEDVVRALGRLALGTRLKRLGERLQAQSQVVLDRAGIDIPSAQCPVLAALDRHGPMSVGELAQALGVSQPGVTRMAGKLEAAGHVTQTRGAEDRRVSTVSLTPAGRRVVARLKRTAWAATEAAVADACADLSGSLLEQVAALEAALAEESLAARAARLGVGEGSDASA